ncbi:alpha/beta fold hydrolase [Sulfitobacter donghicola]|uniref:HTH luxR-type domain-containing protein n=1 Tax=Sulfitobacter donghicola DSW-25 = KCTC 12864 = JCM 14565 TaxID=1300350 RepID=A0A073IKL3_9RHOB|nr:alpha/beta fold hydrolase [Sulfitobacter donghicola]KEJ90309.1 hypothetical protein DSW25_06275 [Sulfitobacter donghicola DSW-25 = KCTC 12864 = JCM 14565]KIN67065.1 Transcriptional regulator, LuxR family/hydrolase, alpha/beta fold family protein [Sulfitobacter donghicola DSW-25 = KCTC 12864 = JCM 14565]
MQDFLETWGNAADLDEAALNQLGNHLGRASEVLDRISKVDSSGLGNQQSALGLEAVVNFDGSYTVKSKAWEASFPASRSLFDILPDWHHSDIEAAFFEMRKADSPPARLVVCRGDNSTDDCMVLIYAGNQSSGELTSSFHIRLLRSAWSQRLSMYFSTQHGLSTAELSVFELFVKGLSNQTIAQHLGKSQETIRTQSKAIYAKIGVSGREAAVRFALHLQFMLPLDPTATSKALKQLESEVITVQGYKIGITRKGMLSGKPFILLHGIVSGYEFGATFEEELRRANLCAICVERPGYGRSDNPKTTETILDEWLTIFPALLDALGLEQSCLVTHASGATYVAATLAQHPKRTGRGICISAGMPNFDGVSHKKHPVSHRFLYWCLRNSPESLGFYFKAYAAYLSRGDNYNKLIMANYARNPSDCKVLEDRAHVNCVIAGYKLLERPKMMGLRGDLISLWQDMERWKKITASPQPHAHLHHIWGAKDQMISLEASQAYCDSHSFTSWSILEGGGHLLPFSHPQQIVHRIARMVHDAPDWAAQ